MAEESNSEPNDRLIVYGSPASQPSRAVYWTCAMRGLPFELRTIEVEDMGNMVPLLELNPSGQVPTVQDGAFVIFEMPAILVYLCEKHGWDDLLPKDLHTRARVHQYLHFHHNFTRRATVHLMAPHVTVAFPHLVKGTPIEPLLSDPDKLEKGRAVVRQVAELLERGFFPSGSTFVCGERATLADVACYEELAQLRWASLFDFEGFAKIRRWLDAMRELPFHEEAHRYNTVLGDIRTEPNTLERFVEANLAGLAALGDSVCRPG